MLNPILESRFGRLQSIIDNDVDNAAPGRENLLQPTFGEGISAEKQFRAHNVPFLKKQMFWRYSTMVSLGRATQARAPRGLFIDPYTRAALLPLADPVFLLVMATLVVVVGFGALGSREGDDRGEE